MSAWFYFISLTIAFSSRQILPESITHHLINNSIREFHHQIIHVLFLLAAGIEAVLGMVLDI